MIRLDRFKDGKTLALTMSYDDAQIHDRRLVEIFNKYGIKGTFHINSGILGTTPDHISPDEVKTLYSGHEVACHGLTHAALTMLPKNSLVNEVLEDKKNLEALCGDVVRGMSYAFGLFTDEIIDVLKQCGIAYSRKVASTKNFLLPTDFYKWEPTCHHRFCPDLAPSFAAASDSDAKNSAYLFYVWGHSYEFDRDNNWDMIEDFCKTVGNRENVWYATNIEICDYITAQRNLQISADESIVHNPSAVTVWFSKDGKTCKVEPNETIKI